MISVLIVTTAASDLHLLSLAEMREAAGVTGSSQDARLSAVGLSVAAAIMDECNIAAGTGGEPTLKRETLEETFRWVSGQGLTLARRHDVAVSSIVEDGRILDPSDYIVDPEAGVVTRLWCDAPGRWCAHRVTVTYQAGFVVVPADLKMSALDFFRAAWREKDRDPMVRAREVDIPDVRRERTDYWVGSIPGQANEGAVPDIVAGQLKRFRNAAVG